MKVLADFKNLTGAEAKLVAWLQAGNRKTFVVSDSVPNGPGDAVTLRATFVRYLVLGGCEDCRLPETGLQVKGAYVEGNETNCEFTRGLSLEGATLPHDLVLAACNIPDVVNLRSAKVKDLLFDGSTFEAGLIGEGLIAEGGLRLRNIKIVCGFPTGDSRSAIRLGNARFGSDLSLNGSVIFEKYKCNIRGLIPIHCDGTIVDGSLFLRNAALFGQVRFLGARIAGSVFARSVHINHGATDIDQDQIAFGGDNIQVTGTFDMKDANIHGETRLLAASIEGSVVFSGCEIISAKRALNCDRMTAGGTLFLRDGCKFVGQIDLTAATIGAINDEPTSWPPELLLDRCRYGAFLGSSPIDAGSRLRWLALTTSTNSSENFGPDPYEHCAKVLREMGHGADARAILIKKEELQRAAQRDREEHELAALRSEMTESRNRGKELQRKVKILYGAARLWANRKWDNALGFLVGYGRKPLDALWRGLLPMWAFGYVVFFLVSWLGEIKPNLPQTQVHPAWVECAEYGARRWVSHATQVECFRAQPEGKSYPHFNALFYSADTLFPVVSLEMQSYWIPDDTKPFGMLARWYLWLHIAAGWALTLLAVAGFSGLIKTDSR